MTERPAPLNYPLPNTRGIKKSSSASTSSARHIQGTCGEHWRTQRRRRRQMLPRRPMSPGALHTGRSRTQPSSPEPLSYSQEACGRGVREGGAFNLPLLSPSQPHSGQTRLPSRQLCTATHRMKASAPPPAPCWHPAPQARLHHQEATPSPCLRVTAGIPLSPLP